MRAETIVNELLKSKESSPQESITHYFGLICLKATTEKGVSLYIQYLKSQEESAEEELSFRFEPIFFKRPDVVLSKIKNENWKFQKILLDHIGWGFLNNTPSATRDSYKRIFFEKNPDLKGLYNIYMAEIDQIFQGIEKYYAWLENRKK
jgi:hypothetical protein